MVIENVSFNTLTPSLTSSANRQRFHAALSEIYGMPCDKYVATAPNVGSKKLRTVMPRVIGSIAAASRMQRVDVLGVDDVLFGPLPRAKGRKAPTRIGQLFLEPSRRPSNVQPVGILSQPLRPERGGKSMPLDEKLSPFSNLDPDMNALRVVRLAIGTIVQRPGGYVLSAERGRVSHSVMKLVQTTELPPEASRVQLDAELAEHLEQVEGLYVVRVGDPGAPKPISGPDASRADCWLTAIDAQGGITSIHNLRTGADAPYIRTGRISVR